MDRANTVTAALQLLQMQSNDVELAKYTTVGEKPKEIATHTEAKTFYITGICLDDFIKEHGSVQFDMLDLEKRFAEVCKDYGENITLTTKSYAIEFCSKIIFEVVPESRKLKKAGGHKVYKCLFNYSSEGSALVCAAFVTPFKSNTDTTALSRTNNKITLTIEQASLLAVQILARINKVSFELVPPILLLTTLAGAVFSKDDLDKIAVELNTSPLDVVKTINASCQSGGQYIMESSAAVAAVGAISATRNIKSVAVKKAIITKTVKQYLALKKPFNVEEFKIYSRYAHGGIPSDLQAEKLIALFDENQKLSKLEIARAIQSSVVKSTIQVPVRPKKKDDDDDNDDEGGPSTGARSDRHSADEQVPSGYESEDNVSARALPPHPKGSPVKSPPHKTTTDATTDSAQTTNFY